MTHRAPYRVDVARYAHLALMKISMETTPIRLPVTRMAVWPNAKAEASKHTPQKGGAQG